MEVPVRILGGKSLCRLAPASRRTSKYLQSAEPILSVTCAC